MEERLWICSKDFQEEEYKMQKQMRKSAIDLVGLSVGILILAIVASIGASIC